MQGGQQGRYGGAGGQRICGPAVGVEVVDRAEAGTGAEQGERGAQPGQGAGEPGGPGQGRQGVLDLPGQSAQGGDLGREGGAPGGVGRERAAEHQVPHVFEAAGGGELDGRVLAVVVEALPAPDVAQPGFGDHDSREAAGYFQGGVHGSTIHDGFNRCQC